MRRMKFQDVVYVMLILHTPGMFPNGVFYHNALRDFVDNAYCTAVGERWLVRVGHNLGSCFLLR